MASYDNLVAEQPWPFRPAFGDAWISDLFTKETETLTKALQNSFAAAAGYEAVSDVFSSEMVEYSPFAKPETTPLQTPTASGGSENEVPFSKHRRSVPPPASGRITKRKSRASKRSATTTFIAADPANFRQLVQQVTGVRFSGGLDGQLSSSSVLKSEPGGGGLLPTLDTSAFLLDGSGSSTMSPQQTAAPDGGAAASGTYFDSFCSFPTLESWEAV